MRGWDCGSWCDCGKGCILSLVKGWEPKLLRMCILFDWVRLHVWKLVERCRVSRATVMQVCASVCLLGCLEDGWKWKVPVTFWDFLSFIHTNFIGGCQCNTGGVLGGVGGHPSSQMWGIMHIILVMFKTHFSRFWPNYLLFWPFYYVGLFICFSFIPKLCWINYV